MRREVSEGLPKAAGRIKEADKGAESLRNLYLSVSRMASVVDSMRDLAAADADASGGEADSLARASDVLALAIAVETLLLVEGGKGGVVVSDWTKRLAGLTLATTTRLAQSIGDAARHLQGTGGGRVRLEGALLSAARTIGRLRNVLVFLCCSWVVAEISGHVLRTRSTLARGGENRGEANN
jgi:hypothetical protein